MQHPVPSDNVAIPALQLPRAAPDDAQSEDEWTLLYGMYTLRAVFCFERKEDRDDSVRRIQLIVPRCSPVTTILDFHSSECSLIRSCVRH